MQFAPFARLSFFLLGLLAPWGASLPQAHAKSFVSVCDRTEQVRDAIVFKLNLRCEKITGEDLARIDHLHLADRRIERLRVKDFSGLTGLKILDLNRNALKKLPVGLWLPPSLLALYLRKNSLKNGIPGPVMHQLPRLKALDISENQMQHLPDLSKNAKLEDFYAHSNAFDPEDNFVLNPLLRRFEFDESFLSKACNSSARTVLDS